MVSEFGIWMGNGIGIGTEIGKETFYKGIVIGSGLVWVSVSESGFKNPKTPMVSLNICRAEKNKEISFEWHLKKKIFRMTLTFSS